MSLDLRRLLKHFCGFKKPRFLHSLCVSNLRCGLCMRVKFSNYCLILSFSSIYSLSCFLVLIFRVDLIFPLMFVVIFPACEMFHYWCSCCAADTRCVLFSYMIEMNKTWEYVVSMLTYSAAAHPTICMQRPLIEVLFESPFNSWF